MFAYFKSNMKMAAWRGRLGPLGDLAGGSDKAPEMELVHLCAQVPPGLAGRVLGDPDEQQGEPAEQDVRADALLGGGRPGAGRASSSCPARPARPRGAACTPWRRPPRRGSGRWCAGGTCRRASRRLPPPPGRSAGGPPSWSAGSAGWWACRAGRRRASRARPATARPSPRSPPRAARAARSRIAASRAASDGLRQTTKRSRIVPVVEDDLLDLEVAGHDVVAALAGEGGLRLGRVAPQLLAADVVAARALEVAAVLGRVEAPVGDPHDPPELPGRGGRP